MKSLNDLGYKSFKKVTFDSHFKFYDLALESHANITPLMTKERLAIFFSNKNSAYIKSKWAMINKFAQEENIDLDPSIIPTIEAVSVQLSEANPLGNLSPSLYIHRSRPLHSILKSMNVMSKNLVAQNIFLEASSVKKFEKLMAENGIDLKTYQILNGSGLPVKSANFRRDNLATCRTVIKVVELLNKSIETKNFFLSDIVAVNGGKDLGSFRERFKLQPETHEAVLSKTGTVANTSTLAGVLMMENQLPFAILNSTSRPSLGRTFQDNFVARMFHHLGAPVPISYTKLSIFPWDGEEFLNFVE
jgi:D-alanyl-D-alanine carboxypeptidase